MSLFKKDPNNSYLVKYGIAAGVIEVIYIALLIVIGNIVASNFRLHTGHSDRVFFGNPFSNSLLYDVIVLPPRFLALPNVPL